MDELKNVVAKNIVELRRSKNITQLELAEMLNYTDKAISKWERGESLPDIIILKKIADLFEVSVDYLLTSEHSKEEVHKCEYKTKNHKLIIWMTIFLTFLLATFIFAIAKINNLSSVWYWLPFVYAVPVSTILGLIFNSIWFKGKHNYMLISLLLWTTLASVFLSFLAFEYNLWMLFLVGVPGQAIILLWSGVRRKSENKI